MIRYRNTDNGMVVEVPGWMALKYDASCNMERIPEVSEEESRPTPASSPRPPRPRKAAKR